MHYEDKLVQLEAKIQATQVERDQVLASYSESKQPSDKVRLTFQCYLLSSTLFPFHFL